MKTKLKLYSILLLIATFFLLKACDDGPTESEKLKSPRDYTWTADTIYNPNNYQTLMSSIWGSSENNIYMCGHSSNSPGGLWHFDGSSWKVVDTEIEVGFSAPLEAVGGSSPNNVWVVGYRKNYDDTPIPFIIYYNGLSWERINLDVATIPACINVMDDHNIWFGGSEGIICHYDKFLSKWSIDTLYSNFENDEKPIINSIAKYNNEIYTFGYRSIDNGLNIKTYLFVKSNSGWKLLGQYSEDSLGIVARLFTIENNLYSVGELGVYQWVNNQWNVSISTEKSISQIGQTSLSNMLLVSGLGYIYHYNGKNLERINQLTNKEITYSGVWMGNSSITLIGYITHEIPNKTIVIKGE